MTPFLVAREWRNRPDSLEIRSPEDGRSVAVVALASKADADDAAGEAAAAAASFARVTTDERRRLLEGVSAGLLARIDAFAGAICDEAGKPITLARGEVQRAAETFHLAAGDVERHGGQILPADFTPATASFRCFVKHVPRGPVLAIGPFNFPLNLLAHKVAPALAVGAPVVVKPPPQAPGAALLLGRLIDELAPATWPKGFLSVLPCANEVAEQLARDDRFAVLSFTGSGPVGWHLKELAGRKHVVLELGGDAACIVCEDADLERAAKRIAWGAAAYAGQVCISVQRVFVHASVRRDFEGRLADAVRAIPTGAARDARTVSGAVIDDRAAERIERAIATGGTLVAGGRRSGRAIEPTLLADPDPSSAVATAEVFGPVAALASYERFDDALARVNASPFGLQAGLYTNDVRRIFEAHDVLRVGGLVVNDVPTLRLDNYPYGGTKGSGIGREGGPAGLAEYTEPRVLLLNAT